MSDEDSFKLCASLNDAKERMYNLLNSLLERYEIRIKRNGRFQIHSLQLQPPIKQFNLLLYIIDSHID